MSLLVGVIQTGLRERHQGLNSAAEIVLRSSREPEPAQPCRKFRRVNVGNLALDVFAETGKAVLKVFDMSTLSVCVELSDYAPFFILSE